MKVMLNTEKIYTIRRIFQNNKLLRENFIPNLKTSASQIPDINYTQNNFIKKIINFFKPKEFNVEKSPIIAKLETPYGRYDDIPDPKDLKFDSVDRIMAEIYIKQAKNGVYPDYTINHNIEQLRHVPDAVKELIKPRDISPNGHIDQNTINKAYSIAKKAGEISPYEYPPSFAGETNISEGTIPNLLSKSIDATEGDISHEIPSDISGLDAPLDVVDSRFKIFDKINPDNGIDVDNLADLSEHTTDILGSELIENVVKKSESFLENLLDSLSDFH